MLKTNSFNLVDCGTVDVDCFTIITICYNVNFWSLSLLSFFLSPSFAFDPLRRNLLLAATHSLKSCYCFLRKMFIWQKPIILEMVLILKYPFLVRNGYWVGHIFLERGYLEEHHILERGSWTRPCFLGKCNFERPHHFRKVLISLFF